MLKIIAIGSFMLGGIAYANEGDEIRAWLYDHAKSERKVLVGKLNQLQAIQERIPENQVVYYCITKLHCELDDVVSILEDLEEKCPLKKR